MHSKWILSALLIVSASVTAQAADKAVSKPVSHAGTHAHRVSQPAQRVFIDPLTGEARAPTREERQKLRTQESANQSIGSDEKPRTAQFSDGSTGVYLRRPKNQLFAHIGKDGRVTTQCNDPENHKVLP